MKVICVGRNYTDHIKELENQKPESPVLFLKPDSSIILNNRPFYIPDFSIEIHYETEIIVKISRIGKHIQTKFKFLCQWEEHQDQPLDKCLEVFEFSALKVGPNVYTLPIDIAWEKSKAFDGSCFISPWIEKSSFSDINNINFMLKMNDSLVQNSNTSYMLWKVDELISYISKYFTLKIGDVIFTGTPSGVGKVTAEDVLEGYIENKKIFNLKIK